MSALSIFIACNILDFPEYFLCLLRLPTLHLCSYSRCCSCSYVPNHCPVTSIIPPQFSFIPFHHALSSPSKVKRAVHFILSCVCVFILLSHLPVHWPPFLLHYSLILTISLLLLISLSILHVQDGCTPLYLASQNGHMAVVQLLLQRQADVNICNAV